MSLESWLDASIVLIGVIVLAAAGLVEASHAKKQRMTIRELLDSNNGTLNSDSSVDQSSNVRSAMFVASLISVLAIGVMLARLGSREFGVSGALFALLLGVVATVLFGRIIPLAIADRFNTAESDAVHRVGSFVKTLVLPATVIADAGVAGLGRILGRGDSGESNGSDHNGNGDFSTDDSDHDGIQDNEHEMISGILSMEDATAREIMVPRPDVIAIPVEMAIPDVVEIALRAGHSRIPVYNETIDRIQGIVYAKDLLRFVTDEVTGVQLRDMVRPALFVPESKRVDDLLRELRQSKVHMAVVVDEYGGTAGIVTIEDILEEIVGEIQDEYDRELPLYQFGSTGEITVDGRMSVEELSELIGIELPETESETVGGFIQRQLGRIPEPGETVQAGQVAIRVESIERRRVRTLRVSTLDEPDPLEAPDSLRAN